MDDIPSHPTLFRKGRGVAGNRNSRHDAWTRESEWSEADDRRLSASQPTQWTAAATAAATAAVTAALTAVGSPADEEKPADEENLAPAHLRTTIRLQPARSILSTNDSPDVPFDRSINPYQGCEHGCSYCYARPSHANHGLSPGLDFETRIIAKPNAAELLEQTLSRRGYRPAPISLGANTDPYQPAERKLRITRQVLEVLLRWKHPVTITTKSSLVTRDLDLLVPMAELRLVHVHLSIGTMDSALARAMEPRACSPASRMNAVAELGRAGVPCSVFTAPLIPALNEQEMESILARAAQAGASGASYVLLRLPMEVHELFTQWLRHHYPDRAAHVMSLVRQMHDGLDQDSKFGRRMRGSGVFAELVRRRFELATRRLGLDTHRHQGLSIEHFGAQTPQMQLDF